MWFCAWTDVYNIGDVICIFWKHKILRFAQVFFPVSPQYQSHFFIASDLKHAAKRYTTVGALEQYTASQISNRDERTEEEQGDTAHKDGAKRSGEEWAAWDAYSYSEGGMEAVQEGQKGARGKKEG